ncbi:MAG TPA: hypothetical protein VKG78_03290 [Opitutaceae bacterium]|nr:hypothetical protein [Opitutaceae bacterium]
MRLLSSIAAPRDPGLTGMVRFATGAGGVSFLSNLPPDSWVMNQQAFLQSTERQDIPLQSLEYKGLGTGLQMRVLNVGVVALIKLYFSLSFKTGTEGTVTALPGWPYSMVKRIAFTANGQTAIIGARGTTLRARRQRIFRNPAEYITASPAPGALALNTTYPVAFILDVPVAHDMYNGIGWILAQNPSTALSVEIQFANESEVFAFTGKGAIGTQTGTVYGELSTFAVGQVQVGQAQKTLLPDLTVFHGLLDNTYSFANSGLVQAPLIRTAGQLVNYAFNLNNGGASEISPLALTEIAFKYGGNRTPRLYNPTVFIVDKNQQDYNGLVQVGGLTYTYLDFEVDNPTRDLFIPEALVELSSTVTIPATITVNANAYLLYEEESLYPAV